MNKSELHKKYPIIASVFEKVICETNNAKKHKQLIHNYKTPERGISFEKIFEILDENNFIVKVETRKWFQEW
ncbi:MAG: hypothetical protein A3F72_14100 [Bacteroidetes bacterium RIFCSPLOWO2_12_FULL_35_15]|nr:MAG: hypothetical protein A3F72_14100 [Bacteroidetes bacterium RIFCSPLOWO2_12_FULL_35_15]